MTSSSDDDHDVQLGFAVEARSPLLFEQPDWHDWDGGIAGGSPVWLVEASIPKCATCGRPLVFVAQIYAPLSDNAFHRALYVFACANDNYACCVRQQLPRDGPFLTHVEQEQRRFEIVVETEPADELVPTLEASDDDPALVETEHDAVTVRFLARIAREPSQVLRYDRGGKPLWFRERSKRKIPKCAACGAPSRFEFQIMPQLVHFLRHDKLDFGLIAVFTCQDSCDNGTFEVVERQAPI